jgi:S-adenosylmethionine:tRNA-ribosyltransferase-isomerase (queuine synthetase)
MEHQMCNNHFQISNKAKRSIIEQKKEGQRVESKGALV